MPRLVQPVLAFARPEDDSIDLVMSKLPAQDLLIIPDIAAAMNLSNSVVREWVEDGRLPSLPCGAGEIRDYRKISRNTFRRFLEMRRDGLA